VSDFRLKVIAETQAAESSLKQVDKVANEATRARNLKIEIPNYSDLSKNFRDLNKDISSAANGIKDFYKVASKLPVGPINDINELAGQLKRVAVTASDTGRNVGDAGDVIKATFNATNKAAETLVSRLTKIALGLYVIKEAAGLVQGAFGGMFNETIGREIKLRETILKTQTTLASTNKVFKDGKEITDPYQKIVTLTGAVRKNIDSIRERSIALAGVTSGEVIEVFGMVASQVGQIGGGLKEAEDLAINFAAALGTFGIPLYQARQEIGSILRGDITTDSYLAKALGITNEDIAKAKTETGGVVKFLEERLAAAVAGQRIAAEGFSGVVSNIKDLSELVSQNFGAGLLDPLLDSLTKVFNFLFSIRNEIFAISKLAGESIGTVADTVLKLVGGATGGARQTQLEGGGGGGRTGVGARPVVSKVTSDFGADDALNAAKATVKYVQLEFSKAFSTVYLQISTLLERVSSAFLAVGGGLAMLAKGLLSIKIETFKALIGAVESLSPALLVAAKGLGAFLALWGKFMELPLVQELAQIGVGMRALEATGVMGLVRSGFILQGVISNWGKIIGFVTTQFNALRSIIGGVIAWVGQLIAQVGRAGVALLTAWAPASKALQALRAELLSTVAQFEVVGSAAEKAGGKIGGFDTNVKKAGSGILGLIGGMIKFQLIMFAITAAISLAMERFSAYKEAQDKIANDKRVQEAIRRLATTYKDLGENATESQKRAKAFEESLVNQDYDKAIENVEKLKKKIEELRATFEKPTGFNATLVGKELNNLLAALNPSNLDVLFDFSKPIKDGFGNAVKDAEIEKLKAAQIEASKKAREVDKIAGQANVELEAQKRVDLSKEYAELQRQQQNDLFQQRQTLAQKEVEIFRAAGELRIFQMEQANAKLIEGEEGASRTALEALNNYLSVRENGELEIEAAKKDIAIEVANLEKTIADYRFENEKKIAEIRKRSGENEKAMADAQRQAAGQAPVPGGAGPLSQLIGGVESYGGNYGAFNRGGSNKGRTAHGSGIDPNLTNMTIAEIQRRQLASGVPKNQQLHATGKYQIIGSTLKSLMAGNYGDTGVKPTDKYSPENQEKLFAALARNRVVPGNEAATMKGLRQEWIGLQNVPDAKLRSAVQALMTGGAAPGATAAAPTPALQSIDVAGPSIAKYEEAVRGLAGAMERLRTLQAALTNAQTAAAFEKIAEVAFPKAAIEGYQDSLYEAQLTYDAIAASSADAFNPERSALAVQTNVQINRSAKELEQIMVEVTKRQKAGQLTAQETKKIIEGQTKAQAEYVARLRQAEAIQATTLAIKQASELEQSLKAGTKAIYDDIEAIERRNELTVRGYAPEVIEAELNKLQIAKDIAKQTETLTQLLTTELALRDKLQKQVAAAAPGDKAKLQADLDAALALIRTLQAQLAGLPAEGAARGAAEDAKAAALGDKGTIRDRLQIEANKVKKELEALTDPVNAITKAAEGIGNAFSTSFKGVISGSMTAKEALANFFTSLADMFLDMAAQIIAKMITMAILNAVLGVLPGGGGGAGGGLASGFSAGTASAIPTDAGGWAQSFATVLPGRAKGGPVSSGQTYMVGERGPELFVPGRSGTIVANDKMGAGDINVVVNVDAKGSSVEGNDQSANQLGRVISAAVQSELIKQQRPGGILAR